MDIKDLDSDIRALKEELQVMRKTTKNTLRFAFVICIFSAFLVALNFSILLTLSGGIAGGERKIHSLQIRMDNIEKTIKQ